MTMLRTFTTLVLLLALPHCTGDETLAAYGGADTTWVLQEIDGQPVHANASLIFPSPGTLSGAGPCNSYHGRQSTPYPWFKARQISATERACPHLATEEHYFKALTEMTLSEIAGGTLILSNTEGREMVFQAL